MFGIVGITINAKIAEGACAEIYAGIEHATGRLIALKILHRKHLKNRVEYRRIIDEGALGLSLAQHENIAQTYRTGTADDGLPYIIMEYVSGRTLRELLAEKKKLCELDVLKLTKAVSRALQVLHKVRICHKDLKPDNIMISDEGVVKLIDYGLAENYRAFKLFGRSLDGSLPYLAPEMFLTKKPTPETDIYALGCTLYEAAAGFQPFGGVSKTEISSRQKDLKYTPPPVREASPHIGILTEMMILRAIEKDVAKRFHSADEVLLDLGRNPLIRDARENNRLTLQPAK